MGYRIKELREEKNLSQAKLAEKSGVSRTIISNLENGQSTSTTMKTLNKLAKALDTTLDQLFFPKVFNR